MNDLINNISLEALNSLVTYFTPLLELIKIDSVEQMHEIVVVFNIAINYIKEKYNYLSKNIKSWAIIVVKKIYYDNRIKTEDDIKEIIDKFIDYWKSEYEKYCDDIISSNEFNRDHGFILKFKY